MNFFLIFLKISFIFPQILVNGPSEISNFSSLQEAFDFVLFNSTNENFTFFMDDKNGSYDISNQNIYLTKSLILAF